MRSVTFQPDLLNRVVQGMEPEWMENYSNPPDICLIGAKDDPFNYFQGGVQADEIPAGGKHLYYGAHPNGLVRYFVHCGNESVNEGGYGGAAFHVVVEGRGLLTLRGPWSSRASVVNMFVDPKDYVVDIAFRSRYLMSTAIRLSALQWLARHHDFPSFILRGRSASRAEQGAITCSTRADGIFKPEGSKPATLEKWDYYEVFYAPA